MSGTAVACPTADVLAAELHGHPRFEFVRLLSVGSFGAVALANDTLTGAPVALKFLRRSKVRGGGEALGVPGRICRHSCLCTDLISPLRLPCVPLTQSVLSRCAHERHLALRRGATHSP